MADQTNNPGTNPNRGTQNPGQTGDPGNRDKSKEGGQVGTPGERERGTVQEPGTGGTTQPNRDRQDEGFGSKPDKGDRGNTGM